MRKVLDWFTHQKNRAYIYNVLLATSPVVLVYGLATESEVAAWLGFGQAVLGSGLARTNVSTKE